MSRRSAIVALLVVTAFAANAFVSAPLQAASVERHGGCHKPSSGAPDSNPTSNQCCQAGHSAAAVQANSFTRPVLGYIAHSHSDELMNLGRQSGALDILLVSSSSPPRVVTLRI